MKLDKKYIKFYEVGNNRYYLLSYDNDLFVATESFVPQKKLLWFKRKGFTQGLKLLQLTPAISILFDEIINMPIDVEDKDFPDMTTYIKVDNKELRNRINFLYKMSLDNMIKDAQEDFDNWVDDFTLNNKELSQDKLDEIINTQEKRLNENIKIIKDNNIINTLNFKWNAGENLIVKKMLDNNMEFLYTQKIGAGYKIYYLYELDDFGTLTIYKIQCVKDVVKTIDTFIYNRELIQELVACMENNKL